MAWLKVETGVDCESGFPRPKITYHRAVRRVYWVRRAGTRCSATNTSNTYYLATASPVSSHGIFSIPMHPSTRGTMIRRSASRYRGIGVPRAQSIPATQEFSFFLDISSAVWHTYICQVLSVILLVGRKEGRRPAIPPREPVTKIWVFLIRPMVNSTRECQCARRTVPCARASHLKT